MKSPHIHPSIRSKENINAHVSWEDIEKYYSGKKKEWASSKSYYKDHPEWGSMNMSSDKCKYGYELKPCYTEEEVNKFQRVTNIELPQELIYYLTHISRELFLGSYPIIFDIAISEPLGNFNVPIDKEMWYYRDCVEHGSYPQSPECNCKDPTNGIMLIADGGCTDIDYLVVKGNHCGEIWCNGGGGDFMSSHYKYKNFWEYLVNPIIYKR